MAMNQNTDDIKRAKEVLKVLDEQIQKGPWDKSILLSVTGKKLKEFRHLLREALDVSDKADLSHTHLAGRMAKRTGLKEVFVSIYNADGRNLKKWEHLLANISTQVISRPVYFEEKYAREVIRAKVNKKSEAYIAVYIPSEDILKPAGAKNAMTDRMGHELVQLKDDAIKHGTITRFMHISGNYAYRDGHLVREGDVDFMEFSN